MSFDRSLNTNQIVTQGWSNPTSYSLYSHGWPNEPHVRAAYEKGWQCGGCAFFAKFNSDYGLCCHSKSRHHLETVFEHFSCPVIVDESWESHSFEEPLPGHIHRHPPAPPPASGQSGSSKGSRASLEHGKAHAKIRPRP